MSHRQPVAVIDTTLLSRLRDVDIIELLPWVFSRVLIPAEVRAEVGRGPGKARRWLARLLREQRDFFIRCTEEDEMVRGLLEVDLDPGESAVIAQAYACQAEAIVDERRGRERARNMDIDVVPTGAVLLRLKEAGAIDMVAPRLDRLQQVGFRLSEGVRREILERAGES